MRCTVTTDQLKSYIKQAGEDNGGELFSTTDLEQWLKDGEADALIIDPSLSDDELNSVVLDFAISRGLALLNHPKADFFKEQAKEKVQTILSNRWSGSSSGDVVQDEIDPPMIRTRGRVSQSSLMDDDDWRNRSERYESINEPY